MNKIIHLRQNKQLHVISRVEMWFRKKKDCENVQSVF